LLGRLGSEPRLAPSLKQLLAGALAEPPRLGRGTRALPQPSIVYPSICLTTEDNHGKPVRVAKKCSAVQRRTRSV
jgi:hypothetical protein